MIRTILTLIILPPARNFSKDRVMRLRLTIPLIMAPLKPCAAKSDCERFLAPQVYVPGQHGSLQVSFLEAPTPTFA